MNKQELTRREFLRVVGVTALATVLHGCAPSTLEPARLKIVYPRNETKVTNPSVNFQWNSSDRWFILEVFIMKKNSNAESYFWEFAFSSIVNTTNFDYSQNNGYPLDRGLYYYWQVTSYDREIPLPPIDTYTLPRDFIVDESDSNSIPVPTRSRLEGEIDIDSGKFFIKPWKNYLAEYLNRVPDWSPIIPLVYYYLDRYNKSDCKDCGDCPSESICLSFPKATAAMKGIPPEMVENILYNFEDAGVSIPGEEDPGWMEDQIQRLIEGTVLEEISGNKETIDKTIRVFRNGETFCASSPDDPGALQIHDGLFQYLGSMGIDEGDEFILTISGYTSSINERLVLKIGGDGLYYLYPVTSQLNRLDSALFDAALRLPNGEEIQGLQAFVRGGPIILLSIDPSEATEGQSDIKIIVRNGGAGERLILRKTSSGLITEIPMSRVKQELGLQIFEFDLSGTDLNGKDYLIMDGEHTVVYRNTEEDLSNEKLFLVRGQKYIVKVGKIECIDESNPEWWGDDSICFSTLINTEHFLQHPSTSQVYDGFSDGHIRDTFNNGDNFIYHRSDPKVGSINGRIIENNLSISMGIIEYDDWGWLGWLIDKIIDIVQSILEDLINIFTFGIGGYIIEIGLEASGLNRMREQAINSLITGFEFELICEGTTTAYVDNGKLILPELDARGEAGYKVFFELEQV